MKFGKNDEAVSPVIGVILMVAITVILAAVIAAFVFGMGPPKQAPQASIQITSASSATSNVTLSHQGGDSIDLYKVKAIIEEGTGRNVITLLNGTGTQYFTAGDNLLINSNTGSAGQKVWLNGVSQNAAIPSPSGNFTLVQGKVTVTLIDTDSSQQIGKIIASVT